MNAKRDENRIPTVLGVDGSGNVVVIEADGSTSRLLIEITAVSPSAPTTLHYGIDENHVPVPVMELDDGTGVTPFIYDAGSGLLLCDVLVEP